MRLRKHQPFWTSVILHAVVLLGLLFSTIVEAFRPKEKEHVFVMVDTPNAPTVHSADSSEPPPSLDLPDIQKLPDIPDPVLPPTLPKPTQPTPTPVKPREIVNFDDFKQEHKIRDPKPQQPRTQNNFQAPTINVPRTLDNLLKNQPPSEQSRQLTPSQMSALDRYGAQLNARLNAAWRKPASLAGVQLRVTVVFKVAPGGRISGISLRPGSGNSAFDQSVIAAFNRIASAGATPTGQSHTFTMTFRMVE